MDSIHIQESMILITYDDTKRMKAANLNEVRRWFDIYEVGALFQWLQLEKDGKGSSLCGDWHIAKVDGIGLEAAPLESYEWYEDMLIEIYDPDGWRPQIDPNQLKMF